MFGEDGGLFSSKREKVNALTWDYLGILLKYSLDRSHILLYINIYITIYGYINIYILILVFIVMAYYGVL